MSGKQSGTYKDIFAPGAPQTNGLAADFGPAESSENLFNFLLFQAENFNEVQRFRRFGERKMLIHDENSAYLVLTYQKQGGYLHQIKCDFLNKPAKSPNMKKHRHGNRRKGIPD